MVSYDHLMSQHEHHGLSFNLGLDFSLSSVMSPWYGNRHTMYLWIQTYILFTESAY